MSNYEIIICSTPQYKKLIAEIWYDGNLIAEINQENKEPEITFFSEKHQMFQLTTFIEAIDKAIIKLNIDSFDKNFKQ